MNESSQSDGFVFRNCMHALLGAWSVIRTLIGLGLGTHTQKLSWIYCTAKHDDISVAFALTSFYYANNWGNHYSLQYNVRWEGGHSTKRDRNR